MVSLLAFFLMKYFLMKLFVNFVNQNFTDGLKKSFVETSNIFQKFETNLIHKLQNCTTARVFHQYFWN